LPKTCLRQAGAGHQTPAVYVILQAFDNAADQVKAALPQGSVFAKYKYNGGVPLILIHQ